jgi:hypothetical protein
MQIRHAAGSQHVTALRSCHPDMDLADVKFDFSSKPVEPGRLMRLWQG